MSVGKYVRDLGEAHFLHLQLPRFRLCLCVCIYIYIYIYTNNILYNNIPINKINQIIYNKINTIKTTKPTYKK